MFDGKVEGYILEMFVSQLTTNYENKQKLNLICQSLD